MSVFSVPRALVTLAADALEAVVFWLTPHDLAAADRLWDEATRRHEWADGLAEREAEQEVAEPRRELNFDIVIGNRDPQQWWNLPGRPDPSTGRPGTPTDELVAAINFGLENCPEDGLPPIAGYPRFTRSNPHSSSVDGEAAVSAVSGPSAGESPAPDSSAVTDAGPPNMTFTGTWRHLDPAIAAQGLREWADGVPCEAPTFWRETADLLDPTK